MAKIINNSIIHEIQDLVWYKNKICTIKKIQEDLVWLEEYKKPINIFLIRVVYWHNLQTGKLDIF
jgi:hypothetical protein